MLLLLEAEGSSAEKDTKLGFRVQALADEMQAPTADFSCSILHRDEILAPYNSMFTICLGLNNRELHKVLRQTYRSYRLTTTEGIPVDQTVNRLACDGRKLSNVFEFPTFIVPRSLSLSLHHPTFRSS